MKKYLLLLRVALRLSYSPALAQSTSEFVVAFGSCNRQDEPQPMWDVINQDHPNLWIWLGDNIYGDSDDMAVLKAKYDLQLQQPSYQKLQAQTPIVGTWDDHDYGRNDAGKDYAFKKQSQQLALDFLQEPANSPRRQQEGIYAAYTYKVGDKKVKVILLDGRYHRDALQRDLVKAYIPNKTGDMLGEQQWQWLQTQLTNSDADVHIIGSGVQIIPDQHPFEKWANFPVARKRLLDLLATTHPKGVLLLSGDRHIGEISKISLPGRKEPIYEITASGLTHSATNNTKENNRYRVGPLINQKHYGLFHFRPEGNKLTVVAELKGEKGQVFTSEKIKLEE